MKVTSCLQIRNLLSHWGEFHWTICNKYSSLFVDSIFKCFSLLKTLYFYQYFNRSGWHELPISDPYCSRHFNWCSVFAQEELNTWLLYSLLNKMHLLEFCHMILVNISLKLIRNKFSSGTGNKLLPQPMSITMYHVIILMCYNMALWMTQVLTLEKNRNLVNFLSLSELFSYWVDTTGVCIW